MLTDYLLCEPSVTDNVSNSSAKCCLHESHLPFVLITSCFLSRSSFYFGCWDTLTLGQVNHIRWKTKWVILVFACFLTGSGNSSKYQLLELPPDWRKRDSVLLFLFHKTLWNRAMQIRLSEIPWSCLYFSINYKVTSLLLLAGTSGDCLFRHHWPSVSSSGFLRFVSSRVLNISKDGDLTYSLDNLGQPVLVLDNPHSFVSHLYH